MYRQSIAWRFGKPDIAGNDGVEQVGRHLRLHVFPDVARDAVSLVKHGQQDAQNGELRIELLFHLRVGVQELGYAFQCEELALEGNEKFRGRAQGIERQNAEGRRAVQHDELIFVPHLVYDVFQVLFPGYFRGQLDFHADQADTGRYEIQKAGTRLSGTPVYAFPCRIVEGGIEIIFDSFLVYPESARGVGLGIAVDEQRLLFHYCQRRGKIDGCGGLPHTAFLISYAYDTRHAFEAPSFLHVSRET